MNATIFEPFGGRGNGTGVAVSRSMIMRTALKQTEIQGEMASRPNRRLRDARNWHTLEASSVPCVNLNQRLKYGPKNSESAKPRRLTGILVLSFLSILVGFMLTAAILNSAAGGNLEAFTILALALIAAIVGFFHVLQAARALDEIEYATHASIVRNAKVRLTSRRQTTDDEPNRQR